MFIGEDYRDEQNVQESSTFGGHDNLKAKGKTLLDFCRGNQGDANFRIQTNYKYMSFSAKYSSENFPELKFRHRLKPKSMRLISVTSQHVTKQQLDQSATFAMWGNPASLAHSGHRRVCETASKPTSGRNFHIVLAEHISSFLNFDVSTYSTLQAASKPQFWPKPRLPHILIRYVHHKYLRYSFQKRTHAGHVSVVTVMTEPESSVYEPKKKYKKFNRVCGALNKRLSLGTVKTM